MWKPAIFLLTILWVTPTGREKMTEYFLTTSAVFAAAGPYGNLALVAIALLVVCFFLLMLCQAPKHPEAQWVWREVRGEVHPDAASNRSI